RGFVSWDRRGEDRDRNDLGLASDQRNGLRNGLEPGCHDHDLVLSRIGIQADSKRVRRDRIAVPSDAESSGQLGWNGDRESGEPGLDRRGMALRIVVPPDIVGLCGEVDRFAVETPGSREPTHALVAPGEVELRSERWIDALAGVEPR